MSVSCKVRMPACASCSCCMVAVVASSCNYQLRGRLTTVVSILVLQMSMIAWMWLDCADGCVQD